jgi:ankyrin repeat protein
MPSLEWKYVFLAGMEQCGERRIKKPKGWTALHGLVQYPAKTVQETERELKIGADPNAETEHGITPVHFACRGEDLQKQLSFVKILVQYGGDVKKPFLKYETTLHLAADSRNRDLMNYLESLGVDKNVKNSTGKTAEDVFMRARF